MDFSNFGTVLKVICLFLCIENVKLMPQIVFQHPLSHLKDDFSLKVEDESE